MKKRCTLVFLLVMLAATSFAQGVTTDKLQKLNGETLSVKVTAVNEREVSFIYPGEETVNTISTNLVKEISFASGRVQSFSTKVEVKGEQDWAKVTLTTLENDVKGLAAKGDVAVSVMRMTPFDSQQYLDTKLSEKLKKKAAKLGAHVVLVTNTETGGHSMPSKTGVAYGYR